MCVSAIAIGCSSRWPLLIAGNRDEFLDRPTLALHEWATPAGVPVWGGRDGLDGGAWLLAGADGRAMALVTNVRDGQPQRGRRSRGQLAVDWIDAVARGEHLAWLESVELQSYGGFNLLCGLPDQRLWWYLGNRSAAQAHPVQPGLYGLSNASLDTPWPKTSRIKQATLKALAATEPTSALWPVLTDPSPADPCELPDTGVGMPAELTLSSVFIDWPERAYGTRSSHVLALDARGHMHFTERTYPDHLLPKRHLHARENRLGPHSSSR